MLIKLLINTFELLPYTSFNILTLLLYVCTFILSLSARDINLKIDFLQFYFQSNLNIHDH